MAEVAFRTVTRTVRLAVLLQQARLRAALQYRLDLVLTAIMGIAYQASGLAFVWVVLSRFGELAGWGFAEIALLCGLRVLAHALWLLPFNAIIAVDRLVREGEFDRYLVRPLNPLVQVLTTRVVRMGSFGDMVTGVVLFVLASRAARVDWSVAAVVFLVLAVVGGALIEGAVQLALGALSFRLIDTMRVRGCSTGCSPRSGRTRCRSSVGPSVAAHLRAPARLRRLPAG